MKLDRILQLKILEALRDVYPSGLYSDDIHRNNFHESFMQNMFYLREHKLIKAGAEQRHDSSGMPPKIIEASITALGLDFLEDDGGITDIVKSVTVKLHPDDLSKLLEARIDKLNIPKEKRSSFIATIKSLPADALKKVYMRLIQAGLDNSPDVYQLLQTYLEQLS